MTQLRELFIAVLLIANLSAQAGHPLLFDRFGEADGLPGTEIYALFEDRKGMVWIGTEAGLARMEGTRVSTWQFDPKGSTSLSNQIVNAITEDEQGTIWVATMHGFQRYLPERNAFERHHIPHSDSATNGSDRIYTLVADRHGSLWLVTDNGLWRYRTATGELQEVRPSIDPLKGPFSTRINTSDGLAYDSLLNGLWTSTRDGLCFLDLVSGEWYGPENDPRHWGCFLRADGQSISCDGRGGVWWFNLDNFSLIHALPREGRSVNYTSIHGEPIHFAPQWMQVTRDGALWMSTWTYRCLRLDPSDGTWTSYCNEPTSPTCLRSTNVKSFLEDGQGALWFGTYTGLDVARPEQQVLDLRNDVVPLESGPITALLGWAKDTLLIGTRNGHLFMQIGEAPASAVATPLHAEAFRVSSLARRDGHSAWVATNRGPWIWDVRRAACAPWAEAPKELARAGVQTMLTDRRGDTWAGTWNRGLFVQRAASGLFESFHDTLENDHALPWRGCLSLLATQAGDILLGLNRSGGVCRFHQGKPGAEHFLQEAQGSTSSCSVVLCLAEDRSGRIWAGTHEGGIAHLDLHHGSWQEFTSGDGLPSNRVNSLLVDEEDGIWALTDRGLARRKAGTKAFQPIPLPSDLDPRSISSNLARTADGPVYFAIRRTLVALDPKHSQAPRKQPATCVTSITLGDTVLWSPTQSELLLPPGQRSLSIQWGASEPLNSAQAVFAYRVVPDTAWIGVGHAGRIDVNGLAPGKHRVELRASMGDGLWGTATASPWITVPPPFQRTWWFRSVVAAVLVVIAWLGVRLYVQRRLARQQLSFERAQAVLTERMRIAGDMHDDLGSGLSALKLRSEMALRTEQDPLKRGQLQAVVGTAGELIGSMRQIIWTMNDDQASLADLVAYTSNYARSYCGENGLAVTIEASGPWPERALTTEQRRNLFLVVKEGLHNVVKHASARHVTLQMHWADGLHLVLADDGIGLMAGSDTGMGNGMRNMHKRIEALGGTFLADGDNGTTVLVMVPMPPPNESSIGAFHRR